MKYLIDSNIIIYYLNGEKIVYDFLNINRFNSAISIISFYEILNYNFTAEEEIIVKQFLKSFAILNISETIIEQALQNRKIKKIKMPDNFIVSTAQIYNLTLVTRNTQDFSSLNIKILDPFK